MTNKNSEDEILFEQLIKEKNDLKDSLRKLRDKSNRVKKERDSRNKSVNEAKEKRRIANNRSAEIKNKLSKYNNLVNNAPEAPYLVLKKEYDDLNWEYQTEVMGRKSEDRIVKRLDELEKQVSIAKDFKNIKKEYITLIKELKELKKERKTQHELVLQSANESEKLHVELVKLYDEMDKIKAKLDEISKKLKEEFPEKAPKTEKRPTVSRKDLKEKADKIMDDFRGGKKKLTMEDLAVLQQHGL